jgi:hypothetical protein
VEHDGSPKREKASRSKDKRRRNPGRPNRLTTDLLLVAFKRSGSCRQAALSVGISVDHARRVLAEPKNQLKLETINNRVLEKLVDEMVDDYKGLIPFTLDQMVKRLADDDLPFSEFKDLATMVFQVTGLMPDPNKGGIVAPPGATGMFFVKSAADNDPFAKYGGSNKPLPPWKEAALHAETIDAEIRPATELDPSESGSGPGA